MQRRHFPILVSAILSAGLLAANAQQSAETLAELAWIPKDASLVLLFEQPPRTEAALFAGFRSEILFATQLAGAFQAVASSLGPAGQAGIRRSVIAAVPLGGGNQGTIGILRGTFPADIRVSLTQSGKAPPRSYHGGDIYPVPATPSYARTLSVAFLDQEHLAFGDTAAVETCIALKNGRRNDSFLQNPVFSTLTHEISSGSQAWGLITPDWLNVQTAAQDSSPSEIDGRSFGRSLASLRWVAFSAQISSDVLFHMQTRAADPQDAALLADELRAYLIRVRVSAAGPPEVRQVVDQAAIGQTGDRVDLFMPVTGPAMQRIKNDEMFR